MLCGQVLLPLACPAFSAIITRNTQGMEFPETARKG